MMVATASGPGEFAASGFGRFDGATAGLPAVPTAPEAVAGYYLLSPEVRQRLTADGGNEILRTYEAAALLHSASWNFPGFPVSPSSYAVSQLPYLQQQQQQAAARQQSIQPREIRDERRRLSGDRALDPGRDGVAAVFADENATYEVAAYRDKLADADEPLSSSSSSSTSSSRMNLYRGAVTIGGGGGGGGGSSGGGSGGVVGSGGGGGNGAGSGAGAGAGGGVVSPPISPTSPNSPASKSYRHLSPISSLVVEVERTLPSREDPATAALVLMNTALPTAIEKRVKKPFTIENIIAPDDKLHEGSAGGENGSGGSGAGDETAAARLSDESHAKKSSLLAPRPLYAGYSMSVTTAGVPRPSYGTAT